MTDAVKALRALYDACHWVPSEQYVLTMDEQIALWDQAKEALAANEQIPGINPDLDRMPSEGHAMSETMGEQNQVPPFRASDIERGLILLRTSSNAHGYTNCVVLTDRIEKLPAKGRQELARMMRNIATEIDGPSPLKARCDKLEDAARRILEWDADPIRDALFDGRGHPSRDRWGEDFEALRSVVDGGE